MSDEKTVLADSGGRASAAIAAKAAAKLKSIKSTANNEPGSAASELDKEKQKQVRELQKALENLYKPENFAPLMRAPADIMLAISGDELWNIGDKEMAVLSSGAANTARYFLAADPKWIALALFATAIATSYGSRTVMYMRKKSKGTANDIQKTT